MGVGDYAEPEIPDCPGADRDAAEIYQWLRASQGEDWTRQGLFLAVDRGAAQLADPGQDFVRVRPTHENLTQGLSGWLQRRVRAGDLVVFYFAGHAIGLPPAPEGGGPRHFLLPSDALPKRWDDRAFHLDRILDQKELRDATVVCWLDTSLRGRGPDGLPAEWVPEGVRPTARAFLYSLVNWPGRTAWLAADGQPAGVVPNGDGVRGRFTSALLNALGPPDRKSPDPEGLMGVLARLRQDANLNAQGFQARGQVFPGLGLRQGDLQQRLRFPDPELVLQRGHAQRVTHFAATPDVSTLITGSDDSTIRIWNLNERVVLRTFTDHAIGIRSLALGPDGRWLVSGDGAGLVQAHDLQELKPLLPPDGPQPHTKAILRIVLLGENPLRFATLEDRGAKDGGRALLWTKEGPRLAYSPLVAVGADGNGPRFLCLASPASAEAATALVALDERGNLYRFDRTGRVLGRTTLEGNPGALALSVDGTRAVVGSRSGAVQALDLANGNALWNRDVEVRVRDLSLSSAGVIGVLGSGSKALLLKLDDPDWIQEVEGGGVERLAWSEDGRWLASDSVSGQVRLWRLDQAPSPQRVELEQPPDEVPSVLGRPGLAVSGGRLYVGDASGGIKAWDLPNVENDNRAAWELFLPPSRGQVRQVRTDREGQRLLEITRDFTAWLWDLENGDGPLVLPGSWTSGDFLPDGQSLVLIARSNQGGREGEVVLVDLEGRILEPRFEAPPDDVVVRFERVSVSPDGQRIVAVTSGVLAPGAPQVRLWDRTTGRLLATIRDHTRAVAAAVFSADSKRLLTIDDGGEARLRDPSAPDAPVVPKGRFDLGMVGGRPSDGLTAAAIDPRNAGRFAVGTRQGSVLLCDVARPGASQEIGRSSSRRMTTGLAWNTTPAGSWWLAASFEDTDLRLWKESDGTYRPIVPSRDGKPQPWRHEERVNSLISWPVAATPMFLSGGDDGTIRFWGLDEANQPAIGVLASWPAPAKRDLVLNPNWVAFTPSGAFDASFEGLRFVRRVGGQIEALEQQDQDQARVPGLTSLLARGESPKLEWPSEPQPPRIFIEKPAQPKSESRDFLLRLAFDADIDDLRLYRNDRPVPLLDPEGREITRPDPAGKLLARVRLLQGENRFFAMATRPGALDGRSDDVLVFSTLPDEPSRLHVLTLGVGDYAKRRLRFATADATGMADHLKQLGLDTEGGVGKVDALLDQDVTIDNVRGWFRSIREDVRYRPQDKVVVFLAGHAEVTQRQSEFALLLPTYPFRNDWPLVVAQRDPGDAPISPENEKHVLTIGMILQDLVRLGAHDRLVIVDACQAESIFGDPVVGRIRQAADRAAWPGRVAYLLATRKGEAALEDEVLKHGLMTYVLLRGTGAPVATTPRVDGFFRDPTSADLDGDGLLKTDELQRYVARTLPRLVNELETGGVRGSSDALPRTRLLPVNGKASTVSFPILRLPADRTGAP
jgi:WD40 repeat protein